MCAWREKQVKRQWFWRVVGLGALLIVLAGISPAVGEINKMGGEERPVTEAMETASPQFGTWEYWLSEETGTLPSPDVSSHSSEIVERPEW